MRDLREVGRGRDWLEVPRWLGVEGEGGMSVCTWRFCADAEVSPVMRFLRDLALAPRNRGRVRHLPANI